MSLQDAADADVNRAVTSKKPIIRRKKAGRKQTAKGKTGADIGRDYALARTRWAEEKAKEMERKNRLEEGELIMREDMVRIIGQMLLEARTKLLSMPHRLAPRLAGETDPADVQAVLKEEINAVLEALTQGPVPEEPQPPNGGESAP